MLKSALLQTKAPLHFHIFADDANQPKFKNEVRKPLLDKHAHY